MPRKGKKKKDDLDIDSVQTDTLKKQELLQLVKKVKEEIEKERENKLFFKTEGEKIKTYWDIDRNNLEVARAKLRLRTVETEHFVENDRKITELRQKVKHVEHDLQEDHFENIIENMKEKQAYLTNAKEQEDELRRDKADLRSSLNQKRFDSETNNQNIEQQTTELVRKERENFYRVDQEISIKFERNYELKRNELSTNYSKQMKEVEDDKNKQIQDLLDKHSKELNDMKIYYNDTVLNNVSYIDYLRAKQQQLSERNARKAKELHDLTRENRRMVEATKEAEKEMAEYRRCLLGYRKDKFLLSRTKKEIANVEKEIEDINWCRSVEEMRISHAEGELKSIKGYVSRGIADVCTNAALQNQLMMRKAAALLDVFHLKDALILEYLKEVGVRKPELEEGLSSMLAGVKEKTHDAKYEIARIYRQYEMLISAYEGKLKEYGLERELGFEQSVLVKTKHSDMIENRRSTAFNNKFLL